MLGQLLDADGALARQRMTFGDDDNALLVEEGFGVQAGLHDGRVHDGHVQVAVHHPRYQGGRGGVDQDGMQGRVAIRQPPQERCGHPAAGRSDAADPDLAGHLVAHRDDVVPDGLELGPDPAGPFQDGLSLGRGLHCVPVDQHGPELLFELGHVRRDV